MVPVDAVNLYVKCERVWEQNREQMWNGESTSEHSYLYSYFPPQDRFTYLDIDMYECQLHYSLATNGTIHNVVLESSANTVVFTPEMYPNETVNTYHLLNRKIGSDRKWYELTYLTCTERSHASGLVCFCSLRMLKIFFTTFLGTLGDYIMEIGAMLSIFYIL